MHSRTAKEQFKLMFMVTCWLSLSLKVLFLLCLYVLCKVLKVKGKSCTLPKTQLIVVFKNTYAFLKQQEHYED